MDLRAYLKAIGRRWSLVVAVVGVSVVLASLAASLTQDRQKSEYRASAMLLAEGVSDKSTGVDNLGTLAVLTTVGPVPERVAEAIGYEGDPSDLAQEVRAEPSTHLGFLQVSAVADGPKRAELIAHTFADQLVEFVQESKTEGVLSQARELNSKRRQLERRIEALDAEIRSTNSLLQIATRDALIRRHGDLTEQKEALETAVLPTSLSVIDKGDAGVVGSAAPVSLSDPLTRILGGAILGFLIGVALALVLERLDTRIQTRTAAETHFDFPVLSEIPQAPRRAKGERHIVSVAHPSSPFAAAFRLLATGLTGRLPVDGDRETAEQVVALHPPQTILITSAAAAEGKTTVAANLAAIFAEQGKKTLIVSCDFRDPDIHRMFGVPNDKGLADALRTPPDGSMLADGRVKKTFIREIRVVPSSTGSDNPGGLLGSSNMRQVLQEARRDADLVLLDTPPILTGSEATFLFPEVDAVLVVARIGTTTVELAERMNELLRRLGTPVIGVALNGVTIEGTPRGAYREHSKPAEQGPRHGGGKGPRDQALDSGDDAGEGGSTKKVSA